MLHKFLVELLCVLLKQFFFVPSLAVFLHAPLTWSGLAIAADAVYYVMRDFGVLRHRQHVVPGNSDRVPHQEHSMPLPLEQRNRLLPA